MREAVLDASVVLKWFRETGEHNVEAARGLRAEFEAGRLIALAPPLLFLAKIILARTGACTVRARSFQPLRALGLRRPSRCDSI